MERPRADVAADVALMLAGADLTLAPNDALVVIDALKARRTPATPSTLVVVIDAAIRMIQRRTRGGIIK